MELFKYICDVPNNLHTCLNNEADILLLNFIDKKRFYRPFGYSLSKQYPVSRYSVTDYKQDSINRINPVLDWINYLYPNHTFFQIQINSMDPNQIYPVHVDSYLFHQHSTRLHIGIKNNYKCEYLEFFQIDNQWHKKIHTIDNFKLYEFNNNLPHSVHNKNKSYRINIIIDIMEIKLMNSRTDWKNLHNDEFWKMEEIDRQFSQIPDLYQYSLASLKKNLLKG